jgi:membrane-associated PAP2 superfamily phosphatase
MSHLGDAGGFALRHQWWLERVLHDAARQLSALLYGLVLLMVVAPVGWFQRLSRWQRLEVWVGTSLALLAVNGIKRYSLTSCPWDLSLFGGSVRYVSHWNWPLADAGPAHCFPGGHASAALAFLAVALPLLDSGKARQQRWGVQVLGMVLGAGVLFGLTQTLRGAHYPSHTFWTVFICWVVALANHQLFQGLARSSLASRLRRRPAVSMRTPPAS